MFGGLCPDFSLSGSSRLPPDDSEWKHLIKSKVEEDTDQTAGTEEPIKHHPGLSDVCQMNKGVRQKTTDLTVRDNKLWQAPDVPVPQPHSVNVI